MVHKGLTLLFAGLLMVGLVGCPEEQALEPPVLEAEQFEEVIPEEPAEAPAEQPTDEQSQPAEAEPTEEPTDK